MRCEQCHGIMIERRSILKMDEEKEHAVVFECSQCGHTESQPLVASVWRIWAAQLAAA